MTTLKFLLRNETYAIEITYSFVLASFVKQNKRKTCFLNSFIRFYLFRWYKITFLSFYHKICQSTSLYKKFSNNLFPPSKHNFEQTLSPSIFSLSTISELLIVCSHHDGLLYHNIDWRRLYCYLFRLLYCEGKPRNNWYMWFSALTDVILFVSLCLKRQKELVEC